jgi:hypothetical protein
VREEEVHTKVHDEQPIRDGGEGGTHGGMVWANGHEEVEEEYAREGRLWANSDEAGWSHVDYEWTSARQTDRVLQ